MSARCRPTIPFESTRTMWPGFAPASMSSFAVRMFDAPAPTRVIVTSGIALPTTFSALMTPATLIVAVPCWSSCQTAISHSFRRRSKMAKHFGCAMSSRFTPPNEGVISLTVSMIFSGSFVASEVLEEERLAFHHGQARFRTNVTEAEDARSVGDDGDLVPLVRQGPDFLGIRLDVEARLCDAGSVPDRKVVERAHRDPRDDLDLALVVWMVLRGLLLREVRPPEVVLHLLRRRHLDLLRARALLRRDHGYTRRDGPMRRAKSLKPLVGATRCRIERASRTLPKRRETFSQTDGSEDRAHRDRRQGRPRW